MSRTEEIAIMDGIPEWYAGKNIFITGSTGFMGKVLVEKLLRCCPDINRVYLLIRPKRGVDPFQREKEYLKNALFEKCIESNPKAFEKIRVIKGDIMEEELGISENDRNELISNVDVVFHCAANVRFDQELRGAVEMNLGGTLRMLELAEKMANLKVFLHTSTTYCHCTEPVLYERSYPSPNEPLGILQMVRSLDDKFLKKLTPKLLNGLPNTYAYSKALTEGLIDSYGNKLPIVVCRPSIVTPVEKEPIPGWVEGLNGPTGLMIGAARGVIRTMHCNPDYLADCIPVDAAINAIIVAAWDRAHTQSNKAEFFNVVFPRKGLITWGECIETGRRVIYEYPLSYSLWYPDGSIKRNYYYHMISLFLFHLVPAYFIDTLLFLLGKKRFMIRVQNKVTTGLKILQYYTTKPWEFNHDRLDKLRCKLNLRDQDLFDFSADQMNYERYIFNYIIGTRKYVLNEEPDALPQAKKLLQRLYIADRLMKFIFCSLIFWLLWTKMDAILEFSESLFGLTTKFFTPQGRYILDRSV